MQKREGKEAQEEINEKEPKADMKEDEGKEDESATTRDYILSESSATFLPLVLEDEEEDAEWEETCQALAASSAIDDEQATTLLPEESDEEDNDIYSIMEALRAAKGK